MARYYILKRGKHYCMMRGAALVGITEDIHEAQQFVINRGFTR